MGGPTGINSLSDTAFFIFAPLRVAFLESVDYHSIALPDDTQLYLPLKHPKKSLVSLLACLDDIENWMAKHFLMLNEEKTEVIVFGQPPKYSTKLL